MGSCYTRARPFNTALGCCFLFRFSNRDLFSLLLLPDLSRPVTARFVVLSCPSFLPSSYPVMVYRRRKSGRHPELLKVLLHPHTCMVAFGPVLIKLGVGQNVALHVLSADGNSVFTDFCRSLRFIQLHFAHYS